MCGGRKFGQMSEYEAKENSQITVFDPMPFHRTQLIWEVGFYPPLMFHLSFLKSGAKEEWGKGHFT